MKTNFFFMGWILLLISCQAALYSQRNTYWKGSGGWGRSDHYAKLFDPKTVETIHGTVQKEDTFSPFKGMQAGLSILIKTTKGDQMVHVGPLWFIENQDIDIDVGDHLVISGSVIQFDGKSVMMAKSIVKGEDTLTLRDDSGSPAWDGWRQNK